MNWELAKNISAIVQSVATAIAVIGGAAWGYFRFIRFRTLKPRLEFVLWDATVEEPKNGYSITLAPLVVKNKVIVGVSGGDYGSRSFIDAYECFETGTRAWLFYTVPGPGERGSETWPGVEPMR